MTPCELKANQRAAEGLQFIAGQIESRLELSDQGELKEVALLLAAGRPVPWRMRLASLRIWWRYLYG